MVSFDGVGLADNSPSVSQKERISLCRDNLYYILTASFLKASIRPVEGYCIRGVYYNRRDLINKTRTYLSKNSKHSNSSR